ncbi:MULTISPECIES: indolepyruvate ferredoxin oxidoreductase family protein [Mycolicibacterium]|uniref:indolepyruvate ferredoxin oxidoreductase family protein n=1 Tax=Mycolicibacterium TaxID=1866885 RepID=UPI0007EA834B|nr:MULTISPECIES: indolepyruvate ferredoxin oxidoreductase family protein [Mycolicibacterium]OBB34255.1 indolepyruvate ferredoxin oxidoreductase [Mycolicibacterium fortuitum]OBB41835.1 indolepyruvate ferredoxin oxidoreductase [Mycolicibacterium fortuitum]OBB55432.1 indolepyruvate ferredoxin oxidoreductase [Mycolicibacterium fortuitum]OBF75517.1 indolepyruvate ferredoxin oxidoreductase [Mycolicibacterium fortuitum]OBG25675.1 indolepyruvate ferredoxin oxidoreductase [Mycolicibacterium fortuitum]
MTSLTDSPAAAEFDLAARYRVASGPVLMTGVQAIARLLVEQHERDRRAGNKVATFVSGYQGSPLAGLDKLLAGIPELSAKHDVRLVPGMNEELAATSVWGSQLEMPAGRRSHDGIVGVWYGKGPGLDRASDPFRHAAMYGAHPAGGALALVGDDPAAKSSSVPAASERSLAALSMPVFFPRNAEEIVAFGLYAVALSRASGCWPAMKLVADVADGLWTLDRDFAEFDIVVPELEWQGQRWTYRQRVLAAPPDSILAEADLYGPRWSMVEAFNAANEIDAIEVDCPYPWLGIIAVGTAYDSTRQALEELGLSEAALSEGGIRIMRVGMPYPLGPEKVRQLAAGVEKILVVEEKTSFVETQVKEILYRQTDAPDVLGKRGEQGELLIPAGGELTAARMLTPLRKLLNGRVALVAPQPPSLELTVLPTPRTPYFCSGCPHNRSTAVPNGSLAGGGIGCHTLVTMSPRTDSQVTGLTQMGGEGAQWIGQASYTDVNHIFQNVGDGTYFHSGQLAVQACIAAGVNITYKVLYNSAVAMTGAQDAEAALTVPELTHKLAAEGVAKIVVCAEEPKRHKKSSFADGVLLWDRDRLDEAQRLLRETPGVTVLIYDQQCAAEARRKRKRGSLPARRTRVVINEAVCEGCGDCGVKSNCLSVQPIDTEFGRKTRIDQNTCNTDYSCLDGECPSFVTVELPEETPSVRKAIPTPPEVAEPPLSPLSEPHNIFLAGIGGTGIVTVNQVLGVAALRAGLHVKGLDQTGLSQKAGPVTSHLRISADSAIRSNRVSPSGADCVLAFDLLTATDPKNVGYGDAIRTLTIASTSQTPTGEMVYDGSVDYPATSQLLQELESRARLLVSFDSLAAAEVILGSSAAANFLLVGAAYQAGGLPIPAAAIEEAIAINGVAVTANQAAFRWGRVAVADPVAFQNATAASEVGHRSDVDVPRHLFTEVSITGRTRELVERRAAQLVCYQNDFLASRYINFVQWVWSRERAVSRRTELSEAVAQNLHKLLAYKDEYEVARLLTDQRFVQAVQAEVPGGHNLTYKLHPPTLKALGRSGKIGFGPRTHMALRVLSKGKMLRGTRFDPFGYARVRRVERQLVADYEATVRELVDRLTIDSYDMTLAVALAPDIIRGYEGVKLRNIERYRARLRELSVDALAVIDPTDEKENGCG